MDLVTIKTLLGHNSLQSAQRYLQIRQPLFLLRDHPSWQEWRTLIAPKSYRCRERDQWTAAERKILKKRHQPETVNSQVSVTINRVVGKFVKQKYGLRPSHWRVFTEI